MIMMMIITIIMIHQVCKIYPLTVYNVCLIHQSKDVNLFTLDVGKFFSAFSFFFFNKMRSMK